MRLPGSWASAYQFGSCFWNKKSDGERKEKQIHIFSLKNPDLGKEIAEISAY